MDKFLSVLLCVFVIITLILVYLAIFIVSFEVVHWFVTGEFFHIIKPVVSSIW